MSGKKERQFMSALEGLFTGARVEGRSGFVNLMKTKQQHFAAVRGELARKIADIAPHNSPFREELFDKLHDFFHRHFCQTGSIHFPNLAANHRAYDRVFADGRDIALAWKTRQLFYVKSDRLVQSIPVELETEQGTRRFFFNAENIENRRANERREFVFTLHKTGQNKHNQPQAEFAVHFSERAKTTNVADILKQLKNAGGEFQKYREEDLLRAFAVFRRQAEADFFIHQNAREFLREQFRMWTANYLFADKTVFNEKRIRQLKGLCEIAEDIIEFIAQFEDELARVWRKPKFVLRPNYVATLDRLKTALPAVLKHQKGAKAQADEWRQLGLVDDKFSMKEMKNGLKPEHKFLPLDTRHFKEAEDEILAALGDLDAALDGELIRGDNWQALNTIQEKYKGRVKCIHVDPPYNTKTSGFLYLNNYQHSSWLTMMENRITAAIPLLADNGVFQCHIDENEYERLHLLFEQTPLLDAGTVIWDKRNPVAGALGVATQHEYVIWRVMKESRFFREKPGAEMMMEKAAELVGEHGEVNDKVRKEFKAWIREQKNLSAGEKSYCEIEDSGRVYRTVHMGAPEERQDPKFYIPLTHPDTGKPCPVPANGWSGTPQFMQELVEQERIVFGKNDKVQPLRKYYLDENTGKPVSSVLSHGGKGKRDMDKLGLGFPYCHPVALYEHFIGAATEGADVVLDFFAGSGTTAHAVMNLNRADGGRRKFVMVELGSHFDSVLLPRLKKVLYSPEWSKGHPRGSAADSRNCGGAFMYCEMEQYEGTLDRMRYGPSSGVLTDARRSVFEQYVFLSDDKLSWAAGLEDGKAVLDLRKLYAGLDVAETLANAHGSPLRFRSSSVVRLADGREYKLHWAEMDDEEKAEFLRVLRPYLWWGE